VVPTLAGRLPKADELELVLALLMLELALPLLELELLLELDGG
jgi:hypothetical protein